MCEVRCRGRQTTVCQGRPSTSTIQTACETRQYTAHHTRTSFSLNSNWKHFSRCELTEYSASRLLHYLQRINSSSCSSVNQMVTMRLKYDVSILVFWALSDIIINFIGRIGRAVTSPLPAIEILVLKSTLLSVSEFITDFRSKWPFRPRIVYIYSPIYSLIPAYLQSIRNSACNALSSA